MAEHNPNDSAPSEVTESGQVPAAAVTQPKKTDPVSPAIGALKKISKDEGKKPSGLKKEPQSGPAPAIVPQTTAEWTEFAKQSALAKFPILTWLPHYNWKEDFTSDLGAGLTVGAMLVPQGLAYAGVAGLPPVYGLYASAIPQLIYALMGTSRQLSVAPVALVSLLTLEGVEKLVHPKIDGDYNPVFAEQAVTLSFMVAIISIGMGMLHLDFVVQLLSHPVISGFTSASAIIIGMSQMKHVLGYSFEKNTNFFISFGDLLSKLGDLHGLTFAIALVVMAILFGFKKASKKWKQLKKVPAALLVVLLSMIITWTAGLNKEGVKIVMEVPGGLPPFNVPDLANAEWGALMPVAFTIAFIGYLESIAVAKIYGERNQYEVDARQELLALGSSNLIGSLFTCYPTTGGFSRTAVNADAGAKTPLASLVSGLMIMVVLQFLTPYFYHLPNPTLGAIVVVAVSGLIDYEEPMHLWKLNKQEFVVNVFSFLATLILGVETGVFLAAAVSIILVLKNIFRPHTAVLGRMPEGENVKAGVYRNVARYDVETFPGILIWRWDADLLFFNAQYFRDKLNQLVSQSQPACRAIVLDFSAANTIDSVGVTTLAAIVKNRKALDNCDVLMAGVKGPVRDMLARGHLTEKMMDSFHFTTEDAVIAARAAIITTEGAV
jgi:SulP family sulfate permease